MLKMFPFKAKTINKKCQELYLCTENKSDHSIKDKSDNTLQTDSGELVLRIFRLIAARQPENMSSVVLILVQKENYTSKENISCAFSTVIGSVLLHKVKATGILHCRDRSDE